MARDRAYTHDVRLWQVRRVVGKGKSTYELRWVVDQRPRSRSFATKALADSRRAELASALNRGEPFDVETGLPISMVRKTTNSLGGPGP